MFHQHFLVFTIQETIWRRFLFTYFLLNGTHENQAPRKTVKPISHSGQMVELQRHVMHGAIEEEAAVKWWILLF